jgi:MFS superfamily sulfate permease-like transporter
MLGVILVGVEQGLAIAVGLAILDQTWRAARPQMVVLGRRAGTTSWEPLSQKGVESVDHTLVVLFDNDIFFANAGVFRRELHQLMVKYPDTKHLVIDAVAISDVDFTGMTILGQVVGDLKKDGVSIVLARANEHVRHSFHASFDKVLRDVKFHDSVNTAVNAGLASGSASS